MGVNQEASGASSSADSSRPGVALPGFKTPALVRGVQNFTLIFLSVGIVALYSSFRRPIWYDEWLHFIWGAFPLNANSWGLLWQATSIDPTTCCAGCCQVATTPTYMFINHLALGLFGANEVALRFPSYLSALFLLASIVLFFRTKGFDFKWQIFALIVFFLQGQLMYYAGEARPYMPMMAAIVGLACYYTANSRQRKQTSLRALVWASAILGSLFHPYVMIYAYLLAVPFAFLYMNFRQKRNKVGSFLKLLNVPLLLTITAIWLFFYLFGWGPSRAQGLNPYLYLAEDTWVFALFGYITAAAQSQPLIIALMLGSLFVIYSFNHSAQPARKSSAISVLLPPITLLLIAIGSGFLQFLFTVINQVPFILRYWNGSASLALLAMIWISAAAFRGTATGVGGPRIMRLLLPPLILAILFAQVVSQAITKRNDLLEYETEKNRLGLLLLERNAKTPLQAFEVADFPEMAANFNIYLGGPVVPDFRKFMTGHGLPDLKTQTLPSYP